MANKLVPNNVEAEAAVLASILVNPDCYETVRELISAEDFHSDRHKEIFQAMEMAYPYIDQLTVSQGLKNPKDIPYLSRIVSVVPTSVHAEYYSKIVAQLSFCRKMISAGNEIASKAYEASNDSVLLHMECLEILSKLNPNENGELITPDIHAKRMAEMIKQYKEHKDVGLKFGFSDIDRLVGGIYPENLVIIGARPRTGKSKILQQIALYNAEKGKKVLFASREMSLAEFDERHIEMDTGINIIKLRAGKLTIDDCKILDDFSKSMKDIPISFTEGSFGVEKVINKAKMLKDTKGLDLIIVDYLQKLADKMTKGFNTNERVGFISGSLKALAKDIKTPVIAACQLNRSVENRDNKKPQLSDLRDSGEIEQDADIVIFLHRDELDEPGKNQGIMDVSISKSRQIGNLGARQLKWIPEYHKYGDWSNR